MSSVNSPTPYQRPLPQIAPHTPFKLGIMSDGHDGYPQIRKIIADLNAAEVAATLDLGDMSELARPAEYDSYIKSTAGSKAPIRAVPGNHDRPLTHQVPFMPGKPGTPATEGSDAGVSLDFLQRFGKQPGSFDLGSLHVTTLDNSSGNLGPEQMKFLEQDLAAHPDQAKVVALHEPPFYKETSRSVKMLQRLFPEQIANVTMTDPAEVARFHQLMVKHGVQQVLSGHTHAAWEQVKDGVTYTVVRAAGGKLMHPSDNRGYGILEFDGSKVHVHQVTTTPPHSVAGWVADNIRYTRQEFKLLKTAKIEWRIR